MKQHFIVVRGRNTGAVLIVLLVALLASSGMWLLELALANRQWQSHRQTTAESLAFAKEALIAYAVNYADNYGHNVRGGTGRLPCPATNTHSGPGLSCGKGKTGYLPAVWSRGKKRIDIDHVERFLDQDLWYSVSPGYRYNPSYNALNSDTDDDLISVDDVDQIVAVIIAPGPPLPGQNRLHASAGVTDYLEGDNADLDLQFSIVNAVGGNRYDKESNTTGNDQLIWIRQSELLPLMELRVLGYVKQWLNEYFLKHGYFPYAAPFEDTNGDCQTGLTSGRLPMKQGNCAELPLEQFVSETVVKERTLGEIWFSGSNWPEFIYYQVDPQCTASGPAADCLDVEALSLEVNGEPSKVLLANAGAAVESVVAGRLQSRSVESRALVEYFEVPDLLMEQRAISFDEFGSPGNDQFVVIK